MFTFSGFLFIMSICVFPRLYTWLHMGSKAKCVFSKENIQKVFENISFLYFPAVICV